MISRRFVAGAAAGFVTLLSGLRMETQFPDQNGAGGHDLVAIHGIPILERPIAAAEVPSHSPLPVVVAFVGAMVIGSAAFGLAFLLVGRLGDRLRRRQCPKESYDPLGSD